MYARWEASNCTRGHVQIRISSRRSRLPQKSAGRGNGVGYKQSAAFVCLERTLFHHANLAVSLDIPDTASWRLKNDCQCCANCLQIARNIKRRKFGRDESLH